MIREGKKKKGSALVVFADGDACATASGATCGRSSNPLVVARAAIPPKVDARETVTRRDDAASARRFAGAGERNDRGASAERRESRL